MLLLLLIVVTGIVLLLSGFAFFHGSFELHPSGEDMEKARLVYGVMLGTSFMLETVWLFLYRRQKT